MTSRNIGRAVQMSSADTCNASAEKMSLTSSTLKRNPKMELSRSDLLRLLSILEGELQAREIVIAVLKAEHIKKLLYPNKCRSSAAFTTKTVVRSAAIAINATDGENCSFNTYSDPWNALSRDAFGAYDPSFDETTTKALFNLKMHHLEALIMQQRKSRNNLKEQLRLTEAKYNKIARDLEEELRSKADRESGSDLADRVDPKHLKFENDIKNLTQTLEQERAREKQIVLCLLSERKQLIIKLIEERQRNEELLQLLSTEKGKIGEMVEGLEEESKRSLQMEAELEKYLSDFESEREKFRSQLAASETRNAELAAEVDRLRDEIDLSHKNEKSSLNIGEGVRSVIVTLSSATRVVPTLPSISTVSAPRAGIARPISPKSLNLEHMGVAKVAANVKNTITVASNSQQTLHSYATVQPISSVKMNATIPPPPSIPAPPPKALTTSALKVSVNQLCTQPVSPNTTAFQNMTYNLEVVEATTTATTVATTTIASTTNATSTTTTTSTSTSTTASTNSSTTQSNHSANNVNQNLGVSPAANKLIANLSSNASGQSSQQSPLVTAQRKLSGSGAGRGTPPPIPPNKPVIKPVLPPQALQKRSKEVNSSSKAVSAASVKNISATIANTNATTNTTNNIKNATIAASDTTGELINCQQINSNNNNNTEANSTVDNVDLLCQELENFNSLLVSMVSTASKNN